MRQPKMCRANFSSDYAGEHSANTAVTCSRAQKSYRLVFDHGTRGDAELKPLAALSQLAWVLTSFPAATAPPSAAFLSAYQRLAVAWEVLQALPPTANTKAVSNLSLSTDGWLTVLWRQRSHSMDGTDGSRLSKISLVSVFQMCSCPSQLQPQPIRWHTRRL